MIDYIKKHERYIAERLASHPDREILLELLSYHDKQISWMQQERMAHLITMMFICLFFLLALGFTLVYFTLPLVLLTALLLILSVAYIFHYYQLENSVQRWYVLSNEMRLKRLEMQ